MVSLFLDIPHFIITDVVVVVVFWVGFLMYGAFIFQLGTVLLLKVPFLASSFVDQED